MTQTIHQEINFNVNSQRLYDTLTNSEQFGEATGGAPTEISTEEGGSFSCFGGMIVGRNIELVPNKRIVQAWRAGNWDAGVYSIVKFEFNEKGQETQLVFDHIGFPNCQGEHLEAGWHENYWKPLERYFA